MRARLSTMLLGVAAVLLLGACTDDGGDKAPEPAPAERLATARANLEKAPAVTFTLASEGLPSKAIGVSGAKGTGVFEPPSFKGTLNATVAGVTGTVEVIAVEQDVYMKFFTPGYNKIDPRTYGAPNPAQLFDKQTGVTSLVSDTTELKAAGRTRDGAAVLDTFTGKVPGDAVADLFVIGDRSGTFDITYGVTEEGNELRKVVLVGPFYAGSTATYTLHLTTLPQAVAITRP